MKKIILLSLILISCKVQNVIRCKKDPYVIVTWKNISNSVDIYRADSLIAQKIPCVQANQIVLHNYVEGKYRFVFKNNDVITEEKKIMITSQK